MPSFKLQAPYQPTGDQPRAIADLVDGVNAGLRYQTLLGVTGSGKTFTMANVIQATQRPTLILAHNKTLAAQLYREFQEYFPENSVSYFVSYYDYYQPEAYLPKTDTYIEKDASINEEIDRLRNVATMSLLTRKDVIVVASVSCIYGLGNPEVYNQLSVPLSVGERYDQHQIIKSLIDIQYERNDIDFGPGKIRRRGDVLEIYPVYGESSIRLDFFGDELERIIEVDALTGEIQTTHQTLSIFPAKHYVTTNETLLEAFDPIQKEMEDQVTQFRKEEKLIEAQRIRERTMFDLEMLQEVGYCKGVENYSRHIEKRPPGSPPFTLLDYFPKDFLLFIDESHISIPQVGGMIEGDRARKDNLVNFGFRLPSARDNRPLSFPEFEERIHQTIFVSATPSKFEAAHEQRRTEQLIRPTGLLDPLVEIRPSKDQIDDVLSEVKKRIVAGQRTLITTLTKRMAEDLSDFLIEAGIKTTYLHFAVETLERAEILRDLRLGTYDVVVGINLLREGLDLPEVSLILILDADKEGFLRSETSLIQTIGRAARHLDGKVIMYADKMTGSMDRAISETNRRRAIQEAYNTKYNITPLSIVKAIHDSMRGKQTVIDTASADFLANAFSKKELVQKIREVQKDMLAKAKNMDFEEAARLRDQLKELRAALLELE